MKLKDLTPDSRNANKGTERGAAQLETSLRKYGAGRSILIDKHGRIIAGNKTAEHAAAIGLDDVIVVQTSGDKIVAVQRTDLDLTDDSTGARELAYADNRVAEVGLEWDVEEILADINAGVDIDDFFREDELAELLGDLLEDNVGEDTEPQIDRAEELRQKWGVEPGQMWRLGDHRIICGDCTDPDVVDILMNGNVARYGMHDPPYGINIVSVSADSGGDKPFGKGRVGFDNPIKANAYSPVLGDDRPFDPKHLLAASKDCILWGANYYADKLPPKKGWMVWDKKGRDNWRDNFSDCELAWSSLPIVTRIFRHTWMGMVQEGEREKRVHPTQKPVALFEKIMIDLFKDDGVVVDFYLGSGTTLMACERLGKICYGCELSPEYVAVALQRWADHTGQTPELITD